MSEHAPPEEFAMALQIIRDLRGQYHALGTEYQGQVATVLELEQQLQQQQQWEGQRELDITGLQARLQDLVNQNWQALSQNIIARADEMLQRIEAMAEDVFNAENVAALLRPPTRESSLHSESTGVAEDEEDQIKARLAAVENAVFGNDDSIPSSPVLKQHQQQQRQGQSQSLDQISRAKERLQERMSGSGDDDDNWKRRVTVLEEDLRALYLLLLNEEQ